MMKNRPLILLGGIVLLIAIGAVGYYLASPLFITRTVDEAFPFEGPGAAEMAEMTPAEMRDLADQVSAMTDEEMAEVPAEQMEALKEDMMAAAAAMADTEAKEPMPADEPVALKSGQFVGADSFHQGAGAATIYELPDGTRVLRLDEFSVTNGPDLHVILAAGAAPSGRSELGEYVDLGSLKGNAGSQNYDIPAGVDLSLYQSVVIYCVPFHVVFATATLTGS